ncbi:MAG: chromosomal replication initiator protein DnaA [Phycisphaerae bacterium]
MKPSNGDLSWSALLGAVRADQPGLFRSWFEELPPGVLDAGELHVFVPDAARARYLQEQCRQAFVDAAMALSGHLVTVRFSSPADRAIEPTRSFGLTRAPLHVDNTFEQFVVGPSNRLAHAAARAVCGQLGTVYNPLFIYGGSGLGKTHLMQAVCAELSRQGRHEAAYVTCEMFVNDFIRAIEGGRLEEFRESARRLDCLVIDDLQFIAERESSQEELFHTFNTLHQSGRQIILCADSQPSGIPTLEERLVSRFNWGLVAHLDVPSRETRHAILQKKARLRGCEIADDVLDYIAERVASNVRNLEGALTKLMSETQIGGTTMTLEIAREVLTELEPTVTRPLQVNDILEAVSRHYGVKLSELIGRKRSRSVSHPRQIGMYLSRKLTPLSLEEIGAHFGGRDHSTVLHAERVIEHERKAEPDTHDALTFLTRQLLARK